MPASGSRTGTRGRVRGGRGERRADEAYVGDRLAAAQRGGEGAPDRARWRAPSGTAPGGERRPGQVVGAEDRAGRQVAGGDEDADAAAGGGAAAACSPAATATAVSSAASSRRRRSTARRTERRGRAGAGRSRGGAMAPT